MDWVVKDKKTGEIKSVVCISHGSGGIKYTVVGGDGLYKEYSESKYNSLFEPIEVDYSRVLSVLTELVKTNEDAQRIIQPLARRLHPGGYFSPGDLVYFQFDGYCEDSLPMEIRKDFRYGRSFNSTSRTFIVLDVYDEMCTVESVEYGRLNIAHWKGPDVDIEKYNTDFSLPICKSGFAIDAYYYLKRYDMPY